MISAPSRSVSLDDLRVFSPYLRLELDELLGDFVVCSLREDPEDGPASLVHVDAAAQGKPAGARTLEERAGNLKDNVTPRSCIVCVCHKTVKMLSSTVC